MSQVNTLIKPSNRVYRRRAIWNRTMLTLSSAAVVFGALVALCFKPRSK